MKNSDHTTQLFEAIGNTVVIFQQIEHWVSDFLAKLLDMRNKDDSYLVSAAMSYGQKVELALELLSKKKIEAYKDLDLLVVRNALSKAEEYRNHIVHSLWTVEFEDDLYWINVKTKLKGGKGLKLNQNKVNLDKLIECNHALLQIREWMLGNKVEIEQASKILQSYLTNL